MAPRTLTLVFALACAVSARANEGVPLRLDRRLAPPPPRVESDAVRFLSADHISGSEAKSVTATGNVSLRQRGAAINADRLEYSLETDTAVATGNVRLERLGDSATGPRLVYRIEQGTGEMESPVFDFPKREDRRSASRASAERAILEGEDRNRFLRAEYTTCPVPRDDWTLKVSELVIDGKRQVGTAWNSTVWFLGVPILYSPWLSFPTNNARKTGFLPPTFGSSGRGGFEFSLPWYWNIAESQDATVMPKLFSKRGLQVGGEYRYLRPTYAGQADVEFLPNDAIADRDRYFLAVRHAQQLPRGWSLAVNAQRVSDDNYFRDLSTRVAATSQTILPRDAILGYTDETWAVSARAVAYQTLQDPTAPVPATVPYRQVPQLMVSGLKQNVHGFDWQVASELTNYRHPELVDGQRLIAYPQVSWPLRRAWGYVTPKVGFHYTRYHLSDNDGGPGDATRNVPLASVDTGIYLDRPWDFLGGRFQQTLEPRLFYLRVPFRDQSRLPNFSTAEVDFGANSLFRENRFIGGDRIGDANQVTAAITSRLVESDTGLERLNVTLGQIYYFEPQRVTLLGPPREENKSDLVALVSGQVTPAFSIDGGLEYNVSNNRARRLDVAARYSPRPGSLVNAAYRYTRDQVKQVDLSAQWPVTAALSVVGRWNWSLEDRKLIEGLAGFEYNAGCWEIRAVAHRFITATQQVSTSFQIQLELSGLSRIGINPLETLRQNIPGYRRSDEMSR
ncbi:MAG TPA: LPS-assembly protein LptD [Usitatibacteraceae bacterium]|nr:LPS-assembly protein LptD [Usitatibacteraceae bacterium]